MDHIASVFSFHMNIIVAIFCCHELAERYRGKHLLLESLVVIKSVESIFSKPTG